MNTKPHPSQSIVGLDLDNYDPEQGIVILVVDDDPDTVQLLKQILIRGSFNVVSASCGQEALQKMKRFQPDLALLDLAMPVMDGWETYTELKKMADVPVIILTAHGTKEDIVSGLQRGPDDYITKPFYGPEVVERIRTVLRRTEKQPKINRLEFPEISLILDLRTREVTVNGQGVHLAPKEFQFVSLLAQEAPSVVDYETIGESVWSKNTDNIRKRTNYMVYQLRQKLSAIAPDIDFFTNVDRIGYKLSIHSDS
jgi:DNA-binding response OmpR family regulator